MHSQVIYNLKSLRFVKSIDKEFIYKQTNVKKVLL